MSSSKKNTTPAHNILLNGCFRSGTTLLDKVLHAHPKIIMASQPFPALYARTLASTADELLAAGRRRPLDLLLEPAGLGQQDGGLEFGHP